MLMPQSHILKTGNGKKKDLLKSFIYNTAHRNNLRLNAQRSVEKDRYAAMVLIQMNGSLSMAEQHKAVIYAYSNYPAAPTRYT